MAETEMNQIEKQILLRAPCERVWQAITNIGEFAKWFGVKAEGSFTPGARVHMISTHRSAEGQSFYVFVEEMEPPRKFSWRWHPGMKDAGVDYHTEPTTVVVFLLEEVEGGTLLTVTESGFHHISLARRAAVFQMNTGGWEFQLKQIEQHVSQAG
ncbi:MAG TPA: SRPBCC family protein [Candidatus Solibacter sp.]|nr:SRPBCC family protein [Candidatus Solibacter sp.]